MKTPAELAREHCISHVGVVRAIEEAIAQERGEADRRMAVLHGVAEPWPLADVLDQLVKAAEHLIHGHDCDRHGWELTEGAMLRAEAYAAALRAVKS